MPKSLKFYGGLFVVFLGSVTLYFASLAQGPDRTLNFVREVPSASSAETLNQAIQAVANWPGWFYSTADVKIVDITGRPLPMRDQGIKKGCIVRLFIDPKRGPWNKFEVGLSVVDYEPRKLIRLRVISDTKGRLTELFDLLEWEIALTPREGGTVIRGSANAHTRNWRSRFFGALAERILMHQVFYPDLSRLAVLKQPLPSHPQMEM
jgi:hypothetical protein